MATCFLRHANRALTGFACLWLAACGQNHESAKTVITAHAATHAHGGSQILLDTINRFRKQHGRTPLRVDPRLVLAAQDHSSSMAKHGFFNHKGKDGSDFSQRMARHGYPLSHAAENIALAPDAGTVFRLWRDSGGHKTNMLGKPYTRAGIARNGDYWTALFSAPDGT